MARDYGKVRAQFWESEGLRALSVPAKFLGLYLLTSPHTNAIGCFRLPTAYISHDTGLSGDELESALAELRDANFALPCERGGWIYIPNYLKHNPPENPNVWRKCIKELDAIPADITAVTFIAVELYSIACDERMLKEGSKTRISDEERNRLKRYGNGIDMVSKGQCPIPCPYPEPIPNQTEPCAVAQSKFDEFWSIFPKQEDEDRARASFSKATSNDDPATILAGTRRFAAKVRREKIEPRFIQSPWRWLDGRRWTDGGPVKLSAFDSPEEQAAQRAMMERAAHGQA